MEEGVLMSAKEACRYAVIGRVLDKKLTQMQAAAELGLSVRQIKRLCKGVARQGASAVVSKRRGKASNHQIDEADKAKWIAQVRDKYVDFGPTLAREYLGQEGFKYSRETLRGWMVQAGLWQPKRKRKARVHSPRARRPRLGELIQIDGSHHDWLEGRGPKCCLIAFIDDATGRVLAARFFLSESTANYMELLEQYVQAHGVPLALYSDRHGIFTKHQEHISTPTQFERALLQLDIESILARSPQAKGRVERLFQTLQDRLIKAMRIEGINSIEMANSYLDGYIARHNAQFAVPAAQPSDAHRTFEGSAAELARICAVHHQRSLSKALSVQFESKLLVVAQDSLPGKKPSKIDIVQYRDERLELLHEGKRMDFKCYDWLAVNKRKLADDKQINTIVDAATNKVHQREIKRLARLRNEISHQDAYRANNPYCVA